MPRAPQSSGGDRPRREAAVLLIECLVYLGLWMIVVGLAFSLFYRTLTRSTNLSRSVEDIGRVLKVGERWRAEIRQATGPLRMVTEDGSADQALHIPQPHGEVVYYCTGTNVLRRAEADGPWTELLPRLRASRFLRDRVEPVVTWRWELELRSRERSPRLRPLFTFEAVAPGDQLP